MTKLFTRSSAVVAQLCVAAVLGMVALTALGVAGLRIAADHTHTITNDEIADTSVNARFAHAVDEAYASGVALALGSEDANLATTLYDEQVPAVETRLVELKQIHEDEADELADVEQLSDQWVALRSALNDVRLASPEQPQGDARLRALYEPLSAHLQEMLEGEAADADQRRSSSTADVDRFTQALLVLALLGVLVILGLGALANRRVRRELMPAKEQVEFADTLQLAESEEEAHQLLQRRLMRVVPESSVTVLNRNNSADRLETMTQLPPGSELAGRLEQAAPRACLAIRSARAHDEDPRRPALMSCGLCQPCDGFSTCTPLTVGGEVIGSVLVNRPARPVGPERRQVREAVSQAAPVLANLRNLAIAQLRAATDALTGLPNKRAVADNLKRLFAQASRTGSPLAVVSLDLDHFKQLNDRFGHPAGDQALASVGSAISSTLRDSDFAGRNGGEEFVVILPNTDVTGALAAAEKIRKAIAQITVTGLDLQLTASLGVAVYPQHGLSAERLERLADAALYVAKRSGRNRVEVATATPEGPETFERADGSPAGDHPATNGVPAAAPMV
jgi:diguanylate cyclase (GGDEF)-like protein